jgi:hypothetical protein
MVVMEDGGLAVELMVRTSKKFVDCWMGRCVLALYHVRCIIEAISAALH